MCFALYYVYFVGCCQSVPPEISFCVCACLCVCGMQRNVCILLCIYICVCISACLGLFLYILFISFPVCFCWVATCVFAYDFTPSPVYSNAGRLESMNFNFQTLCLCLSTLRLLKKKEKMTEPSTWHSTTNHTLKWNSRHHRKETSKYPKSNRKHEYKKLFSSDHFCPPLRYICVSIYYFGSDMHEEYKCPQQKVVLSFLYLVKKSHYCCVSHLKGMQ